MAVAEDITLVERAALSPGSVVAGKYVVSRFVGAGGMAQVFEALNRDIDERVALKLMHPAFRSDVGFTEKFRMEARSAARIRSEYVARVFDVVSTDDGDPVIVMEFLDGCDLRGWVEQHGLPSVETAVGWMIEVCGGLGVAHANGIVHRDVKPENLFVSSEIGGRTQIKLLDFGISRAALAYNPQRAGSGQHGALRLTGTPTYMSPEQVTSSRAADPRMDVWSIGVLLWELFAGAPPFEGANPEEICLAILQDKRADLRVLRPDLPEDLVRTIELCLAKTPEGRPPSVADVAVALYPFARAHDVISVDRTVTLLRSAGLTTSVSPERASSALSPVPGNRLSTPSGPASDPAPVAAPSAAPQRSAPPTSAPPTSRSSKPVTVAAPQAPPSAAPQGAPVAAAPPDSSSRSRWPLVVVPLLLAIAAIGYFATRSSGVTAAATSSASAPDKTTTVTLALSSVPLGAAIAIDGVSYGATPKEVALPKGKHEVTLALAGRVTTTRVLDVDEKAAGSSVVIELPAAEAPSAAPVASAPPEEPVSKGHSASRAKSREPTPPPKTTASASAKPTVQLLPDGPSNVKVIQ